MKVDDHRSVRGRNLIRRKSFSDGRTPELTNIPPVLSSRFISLFHQNYVQLHSRNKNIIALIHFDGLCQKSAIDALHGEDGKSRLGSAGHPGCCPWRDRVPEGQGRDMYVIHQLRQSRRVVDTAVTLARTLSSRMSPHSTSAQPPWADPRPLSPLPTHPWPHALLL